MGTELKYKSLKEYAEINKITGVHLAKLIPCSQCYASRLIHGEQPSYKMAKRIEQVTDFQVTRDVFGYE